MKLNKYKTHSESFGRIKLPHKKLSKERIKNLTQVEIFCSLPVFDMFPFSLEAPLEASTELYTLLLAAPAGEIQIDAQRAGLLRLYLPAKLQETAVALHAG